jgi:putative transposase
VLYLVIRDKKKGGGNITGRINGWSKALNAFAITYGDRINPQ